MSTIGASVAAHKEMPGTAVTACFRLTDWGLNRCVTLLWMNIRAMHVKLELLKGIMKEKEEDKIQCTLL